MKKMLFPFVVLVCFLAGVVAALKYGDYARLSILAAIDAAKNWLNSGGCFPD